MKTIVLKFLVGIAVILSIIISAFFGLEHNLQLEGKGQTARIIIGIVVAVVGLSFLITALVFLVMNRKTMQQPAKKTVISLICFSCMTTIAGILLYRTGINIDLDMGRFCFYGMLLSIIPYVIIANTNSAYKKE